MIFFLEIASIFLEKSLIFRKKKLVLFTIFFLEITKKIKKSLIFRKKKEREKVVFS